MAVRETIAPMPNQFRSAVFTLCAFAGLVGGSPVSAATLYVDDDQSPNVFPTIQAALQAASAGDTIQVLPGTYYGPIVVDKAVTIQGTSPLDSETSPPAPGNNDPLFYSVVRNTGQSGFDVVASNVTIRRFRIVGDTSSTAYPNAGINLRSGSGRVVNDNVIENNGLGIYVEGGEQFLEVFRNSFYSNLRYANSNPAGGIFSPGGRLDNSTIRGNHFSGNGQFSLNIGGGSASGLVIADNVARGEGTFLVIGSTTGARVTANTATSMVVNGVYSFGNNQSMVVSENVFAGLGTSSGRGSGIRTTKNYGNTIGDQNLTIQANSISGFRYDGIDLKYVSGATVSNNYINANGRHGIWLQDATGSLFTQNTVSNNSETGIRVEFLSTNNVFGGTPDNSSSSKNGNHMSGNVLDASDATSGSKTAKTANIWRFNTGATSDPIGLLKNVGGL